MKYIILAGGSGERLWPHSRHDFPKQFLCFGDDKSLLQKTVERFYRAASVEDIVIITNQAYYHLVKNQLDAIDVRLRSQIIVEPEKKNTAPAICLAMKYLQEERLVSPAETVLVCSSDHLLSPEETFLSALSEADQVVKEGRHLIFGILPHKPETGYGYIKCARGQGITPVLQFVEKPDARRAQYYLLSGDYLWNSGMFLFRMDVFFADMREYVPQIPVDVPLKEFLDVFSQLPEISIDYALMEKSPRIDVMPLYLSWSDIGSWDSVYDLLEKDIHQNVKVGNVCDLDTKNCLIMGGKRLISTVGLEDLLIIETEDALFVGKKGQSQQVKQLVSELKKRNAREPLEHLTAHRPWGRFTILEEGGRYKIKRIVVDPGQRLSLQMHYHRSEHWVVVQGTALVTIGSEEKLVHENESIYVPKSMTHRLENPGKVSLELIEVQVGEYVGEDDIVRFEDIYGRVSSSV